jgi:hypothetical protein
LKKISIEEADKILAAHPPKDTNCPYCGVNLKDRMIPISKVKAFIKKLEDAQRLVEWDYVDDVVYELMGLL